MPIYEYRCDNCEHEFETIRKVSDAPLEKCPECEKDALFKKVSAAGFRLKGSGWYETDFKSGKKRNVSDGDGTKDKSGSEDSSSSKSDGGSTKSESKSSSSSTSSGSSGDSKSSTSKTNSSS